MGVHEIAPDFGKVLAADGEVFGPMMSGLVYMTDSTGYTGNCTRR